MIILDVTEKPWRVVHVADLRGSEYLDQAAHVAALSRSYNRCKVTVDCTGQGHALAELLKRDGVWVQDVTFTATAKSEMVTTLSVLIEQCQLVMPAHQDLLDELRCFEMRVAPSGRVQYGAPEGSKSRDDLTMALCLAVHGAGAGPRPMSLVEVQLPPFLTSSSSWPDAAYVSAPGALDDRLWTDWPGLPIW